MSFLSELKHQALALQKQQPDIQIDLVGRTESCERACETLRRYLLDLCAQLNVINPPAVGGYSLDAKAVFPPMLLRNFRSDFRKKMRHDQEVFDSLGMGWELLPTSGSVSTHSLTVNFPPDLERVTQRLSVGQIKYERHDVRHPETQKLQAYLFEYQTQSRGSVIVTPDHDKGQLTFRITNMGNFELMSDVYPAAEVTPELLDELAKKLVGQPSRFGA